MAEHDITLQVDDGAGGFTELVVPSVPGQVLQFGAGGAVEGAEGEAVPGIGGFQQDSVKRWLKPALGPSNGLKFYNDDFRGNDSLDAAGDRTVPTTGPRGTGCFIIGGLNPDVNDDTLLAGVLGGEASLVTGQDSRVNTRGLCIGGSDGLCRNSAAVVRGGPNTGTAYDVQHENITASGTCPDGVSTQLNLGTTDFQNMLLGDNQHLVVAGDVVLCSASGLQVMGTLVGAISVTSSGVVTLEAQPTVTTVLDEMPGNWLVILGNTVTSRELTVMVQNTSSEEVKAAVALRLTCVTVNVDGYGGS